MMQRISKEELAARLERYVACAAGSMKGLNTLLYGWKKKRKYGKTYCQVLTNRDWMYNFSEYVGYDLSKNTQECICEGK